MLSSASTPIIAILALVVGLLIGLLVSTLFNREPKSSLENPLPDKLANDGYSEGARIFSSPANKKIVLFMDGDYYENFSLLTPEQKRRAQRLIEGVNDWTNVLPKSAPPLPTQSSATIPAEKITEPIPVISTPTKPALDVKDDPDVAIIPGLLPKSETLEDLGIEVPSIVEPIPAVVSLNIAKPKQEKPKTIVDQINDVLDQLVEGTENAKKGIRLEDNGHQGVTVWVGLTRYEGVDAVTDPQIQQLIKDAVAKWEESLS
jgi:hypothetical protein